LSWVSFTEAQQRITFAADVEVLKAAEAFLCRG